MENFRSLFWNSVYNKTKNKYDIYIQNKYNTLYSNSDETTLLVIISNLTTFIYFNGFF